MKKLFMFIMVVKAKTNDNEKELPCNLQPQSKESAYCFNASLFTPE